MRGIKSSIFWCCGDYSVRMVLIGMTEEAGQGLIKKGLMGHDRCVEF